MLKKDFKTTIKLLEQKLDTLASKNVESIDPTPEESHTTKKPVKVVFEKSSPKAWEVVFSERGFLIDGTRLSFEEIQNALSKGYSISLNGGKGTLLDAVKMQSIMKYKDLF